MSDNRIFQEYATNTAFSVQLSKLQCNTLLRIYGQKNKLENIYLINVDTMRHLQDRGLLDWHKDSKGNSNGYFLTKAGQLMAQLAIEAGLTVENTNTLRVLKAMNRAST